MELSNKEMEQMVKYFADEGIPKMGMSANALRSLCKKKYAQIDGIEISSENADLLIDILTFEGVKIKVVNVSLKEKGYRIKKKLQSDNIDKIVAMGELRKDLES